MFEFALMTVPTGTPRQSVKNVGEFESIEEAFTFALARARHEAAALIQVYAAHSTSDTEHPVTLLATEWGYDLRREHQTVTRYWIHSHAKAAA